MSWEVIIPLALLAGKLLLPVHEHLTFSHINMYIHTNAHDTKPHDTRQEGRSRREHLGGKEMARLAALQSCSQAVLRPEMAELLPLLSNVPPLSSDCLKHTRAILC